jgi:hypothetical protein
MQRPRRQSKRRGRLSAVRREVYIRLQTELQLPLCHEAAQRPQVPFFQPLVSADSVIRAWGTAWGHTMGADLALGVGRVESL